MGVNRAKTRGHSVPQKQGAGESRLSKLKNRSSKGDLSWGDLNENRLQECLAAATQEGAAVLLGKTSDGGALVLQVLDGNEREKFYGASMDEMHEHLDTVTELYTEAPTP